MVTDTFIIGGAGTAVDKSNNNGGLFTDDDTATWANSQGVNGGPIWNSVIQGANIVDNGDTITLGATGMGVTVHIGHWANIVWDINSGYVDDRYKIVAQSAHTITIDYGGDGAKPGVGEDETYLWIGGALLTLGEANGDIIDGADTEVKISINLSETVTFVAGGDKTDNTKWLHLQGVDSAGDLLPAGTYRTITDDAAVGVIVWNDIDNAKMTALELTGSTAGAGLRIDNSGAHYNYRIKDCKLSGNKYGLHEGSSFARNTMLHTVIFSDNTTNDVVEKTYDCLYINCSFLSDIASSVEINLSSVFVGCKFVDGGKAIKNRSSYTVRVLSCIFYNQTVTCIENVESGGSVVAYNNIFMPATAAARAILRTAGSIVYADYNTLWSLEGVVCDSDVSGDNDLAVDPLFVDADNEDFTVGAWQLMEAGLPDVGGNPTHIGAVGKPAAHDIIVGELV